MQEFYLKELLKIKNGKDHKVLSEGDIPVFGSGGIMRFGNKYLYDKESILLPRKGSLENIQFSNIPFWTVDTLYYTEINVDLTEPYYLYYFLKSLNLERLNSGTGVPSMTFDAYYNVKIKLPSLANQKVLAGVLRSIDSKIELNNKLNDNLEQMAKTLYDYWFVQFDFPDANGKPYKTSGGKMVWNDELKREVPEGWSASTLDEIGNITGGSTPSRDNDSYFTKNGIAWITPKDLSLNEGNKFIKRGEQDVSQEGRNAASLNTMPRGTVLMSSRAPVGYLAIARNEVTTNQGFKSFVPKSYFTTEFIYYTIKNLALVIENNASGSTFKEVSTSVLKTIYFLAPQKQVIEMYTKSISSVFNRQELLEEENQKLAELREWLLPMLMNGQVKIG